MFVCAANKSCAQPLYLPFLGYQKALTNKKSALASFIKPNGEKDFLKFLNEPISLVFDHMIIDQPFSFYSNFSFKNQSFRIFRGIFYEKALLGFPFPFYDWPPIKTVLKFCFRCPRQ